MSDLTSRKPTKTLFLHLVGLALLLLSPGLAAGQTLEPEVQFMDMTATELRASFGLACPNGVPGVLTSLEILSADSEGVQLPLPEDNPSLLGDQRGLTILPESAVDTMCDRLRETTPEMGFQKPVSLVLEIQWQCGEDNFQSYSYPVAFTLICPEGGGEPSQIHAPSTTDPGPPEPSDSLQLSLVRGSIGVDGAYEASFGRRGRHLWQVSAGIREDTVTVPLTSDALALFTDETRIETELEIVPVDVSYGFRLLPPDRRVVPTLYVGAGYAFVDLEAPTFKGGELADLLRPDPDALMGLDEDSFTLNAGFSLRFDLRHGEGGPYVYLGARTRWFAQRDAQETDEEVFLGFGLPVCNCRGR